MPLLFKKRVVAAKVETAAGTYEALVAANAGFRFQDRSLKIVRDVTKTFAQGLLGNGLAIPNGASTEFSGKMPMAGKGATGMPAWASTFIPSCGMAFDTDTYTATSDQSAWKTISVGAFMDGRLKKARGMMGSFKIALEASKPAMIEFAHKGGWVEDPTDTAMLTGIAYESAVAPIFAGAASFTLAGSTGFKVSKIDIDQGNQVESRMDPNSLGGIWGGWIGDISPKITMDPEATLAATKSWYASQSAGEELDLVVVLNGGDNNTITITCTDLQLEQAPDDQDGNGKLVDALGFQVNGTISIQFNQPE